MNVNVQYFNNLGPWVASTFKNLAITDLDKTDFGPKHCQIIQDGNITDVEGSVVKIVTDGELLITAVFTLSSLQSFHQKYSNCSTWQDKVLMLEKFKITHVAGVSEFGEIVIRVEKFCCIGEPKYAAHELSFQLHWASTLSVTRQKCKSIWEYKLLDGIDGTLEFSDATIHNNANFIPASRNGFLSGIRSAKAILIASYEERQILNSLSGWSKNNEKIIAKKRSALIEERENNHDVNNLKQILNNYNGKIQGTKENKLKIFSVDIDNIKSNNHSINKQEVVAKKISENGQIMKTRKTLLTSVQNKVDVSCIKSTACKSLAFSPQSKDNCAYSLIKQNLEREEQRLLNLQQSDHLSSSVCLDANYNITINESSASIPSFKQHHSSLTLSVNKHYSSTEHLHKKECMKLNSLHKPFPNHEIDSLLTFSQNEFLDKLSHHKDERTEGKHYSSSELFSNQYCTPIYLKNDNMHFIGNKSNPIKDGNSLFKDSKKSSDQFLTICSKNTFDDSAKNSSPNRKDTWKMVNVLDSFSSAVADNSFMNKKQSISFKSRKRLRLSPLFEFNFEENGSISQRENKIAKNSESRITNAQTRNTLFVHLPDFMRTYKYLKGSTSTPINVLSPNGHSQIIRQSEISKSRCQNSNNIQEKSEFLCLPQNFQWEFSKMHINAMWAKFVELFLEKPDKVEK